jgi:hypothetical protein
VRDPNKQARFVEAELSALLQAAGGSLPVVKKDERGVWVMEETGHAHSQAKPAAAPAPAAKAAAPAAAAKPSAAQAPKPTAAKVGAQPDRALNKRSTYAGVVDTGPVAGETFEQKVARLKAVSAAAKQRADEGGEPEAPPAVTETPVVSAVLESAMTTPETETTGAAAAPASGSASSASAEHKPTGQADRTLMLRSTYCGVVDTGPITGETFEQKVERLRAVAAAAKQRADGG